MIDIIRNKIYFVEIKLRKIVQEASLSFPGVEEILYAAIELPPSAFRGRATLCLLS